MSLTFLVVPQWQGSGSSRAMRLVDGAEAIRGDLPAARTVVVDVPLEAGDAQGTGVHRLSSIALVRERMLATLASTEGTTLTIGGDCGVELAAIEHGATGDVAVVWFDAHPDLNTPASSPSGAFSGMVLRTLLGDGPDALLPATALPPQRVVLAGTRSIDEGEQDYLNETGIPVIAPETVSPQSLVAAVEATGARTVYIHVDLDVLDPSEIDGLANPLPFGVSASVLIETIRALTSRFPLAGAGITAFAPAEKSAAVQDMPTILRVIGALAARPAAADDAPPGDTGS